MTFTLDTSGAIYLRPEDNDDVPVIWNDLTPFAQGYAEAMISAVPRPAKVVRAQAGNRKFATVARVKPLALGFRHLAPATLSRIKGDCEAVEDRADKRLAPRMDGATFWSQRQAGFARVGAEDRGWFVAFFPVLTPYLGEDGLIYLREAV